MEIRVELRPRCAESKTGHKRVPLIPDVPTAVQTGHPEFDLYATGGILAPAGMPKNIVMKLHDEIVRIVRSQENLARYEDSGREAVGNSPEEYGEHIKAEALRWKGIVKLTGTSVSQ